MTKDRIKDPLSGAVAGWYWSVNMGQSNNCSLYQENWYTATKVV